MCVYFGLEHLVIWELAVVFVLNLVKIPDPWGLCVCREPQGLACQYNSRSRGYCIFSVVIETICVFLLFSCINCFVWRGKSILERKCHDSTFVWSQSCAGSAEGAVSPVLCLKQHQPGLCPGPCSAPWKLVPFFRTPLLLVFQQEPQGVFSVFPLLSSRCSPLAHSQNGCISTTSGSTAVSGLWMDCCSPLAGPVWLLSWEIGLEKLGKLSFLQWLTYLTCWVTDWAEILKTERPAVRS